MALKPCRECGEAVSSEAKICPHCGASNPVGRKTSPVAWGCLAFIGIVFAIVVLERADRDSPSVANTSAPSPSPSTSAPSRSTDWELVRTQAKLKLVYVAKAKETDRAVYQDAIRSLCSPGDYCYILFWSNRRRVPAVVPMSDAEVNAMVASYTHNPSTGFDRFLLTCRIEKDPNKCF